MKVYKGTVRGNTILLDERPDLPDESRALVELKPIAPEQDRKIARRQINLLKRPHKGKRLRYRRREDLYDRS